MEFGFFSLTVWSDKLVVAKKGTSRGRAGDSPKPSFRAGMGRRQCRHGSRGSWPPPAEERSLGPAGVRPESRACPEGSETHEADGTGGPCHSCPCFYVTGNTCLCCSGDAESLLPGPPGAARSPGKLSFASALLLLHRDPGACCLVSGPRGKGARQGWGQTSETALQGC